MRGSIKNRAGVYSLYITARYKKRFNFASANEREERCLGKRSASERQRAYSLYVTDASDAVEKHKRRYPRSFQSSPAPRYSNADAAGTGFESPYLVKNINTNAATTQIAE